MLWIEFVGASLLIIIMPGPDILFVLTQALTGSRRSALVFAAGLCTGLLVHISFASLGLSLLLLKAEGLFRALEYAGALYLAFLGVMTLKDLKKSSLTVPGSGRKPPVKLYQRGIVMNLLNPKVALFFLAFLPGFVDKDRGSYALQIALLGAVFVVLAFTVFGLTAFLANTASSLLLNNDKLDRLMMSVKAVVFFAVSALIFLSA